ncbi:MAG TPA: hypothetical protein VIL71_10170 [Spirillospora sp.]
MTFVGGYELAEYDGLWFLSDKDGRVVSTIIDMGGGRWRARTPDGRARTFEPGTVPADVRDVPRWIAEQITAS